ncbi:MAG: hypothetical protein COC19_02275 [SAR86 cluster bacterium]|uniref:Uncharacterized protein n=1 Tax=SAR86 cluster bacterium TaxID=2030880 RepID=A0A2A4MSQ7_9GAMM|nr:MAG: hypothetical protein COC19_02275 [SAR86 cluster bacterium]
MLRNVRRQRSHVVPSFHNVDFTKDKLTQEITEMQKKMDMVGNSPSQNNLATVKSYKEMISSRHALINNLSRQKDERVSFGVDRRF